MKNWTTSFPGPFDILYGTKVRAEKNVKFIMYFRECLLQLRATNFCFYRKKTICINSLNKGSISLKFLFTKYFKKESNCACDKYRTFEKPSSRGPATLLKKRLWQRCFPVNIVKFLRTPLDDCFWPSCLFEKLNWKLRINFLKLATKNICNFSRLKN